MRPAVVDRTLVYGFTVLLADPQDRDEPPMT